MINLDFKQKKYFQIKLNHLLTISNDVDLLVVVRVPEEGEVDRSASAPRQWRGRHRRVRHATPLAELQTAAEDIAAV